MTITHTPDGVSIRFVPDGRELEHVCRACHATGRARVYAKVAAAQHTDGWAEWVVCPACGSAGAVGLEPPAYETEMPASPGALKYYIEQGAAIDVLANLIAGVKREGPTRILDVGCSFGFLLDYARGGLGWEPQGIDPSTFARAGEKRLGLPIADAYLMPENTQQYSADVIVCSEIIEHLTDPDPFLQTLKMATREGGVIVLTTPSSSGIREGLGVDRNILAHGPGQHIVVYSPKGLEAALRRAGFTQVQVTETEGKVHLMGAASMRAGAIDFSRKLDRAHFRQWLARRAYEVSDASLQAGYLGRLLKLAVAAGAWDEARAAIAGLKPLFLKAGIDLGRPETVQPPAAEAFGDFALDAPCNTGMVLFNMGRVMEQTEPEKAEAYFRASLRYGKALNDRLYQLAALDLETSEQIMVAEARSAGFRALRDPRGAADELRRLGPEAFGPERMPVPTFLHLAGVANDRGLDISPLEEAGHVALRQADAASAAFFWNTMTLSALKRNDTPLALRMLEQVPVDASPEAETVRLGLQDETQVRLMLEALSRGDIPRAAAHRDRLSPVALQRTDMAAPYATLALNHDHDAARAVELLRNDADGGEILQAALKQAFIDAVAGGRMEAAETYRARMTDQTLRAPALQAARERQQLAICRVFADHALGGEPERAAPYAEMVESSLGSSRDSRDPEIGRAIAALAIYAARHENNSEKARRYARRASTFDLPPDLRPVVRNLKETGRP